MLGGYLGAGKTTLLNRLLATNHGRRIGVLVNDFGSVNIDASLIENSDGETVSLTNGCVCCSIRNDLGDALEQMKIQTTRPDQVIVEASGTANPGKVAQFAATWPGYAASGAFVVVDGQQARRQARDKFIGQHVLAQIRSADVLALSKTDLLDHVEHSEVRTWLLEAAGSTPILNDVRALSDLLCEPGIPTREPKDAAADPPTLPLRTFHYRSEKPLEVEGVRRALAALDSRVLRAKGIGRSPDLASPGWVVQRVGMHLEIELFAGPPVPIRSDLVFVTEPGFSDREFASLSTALDSAIPD